MSFDGGLVGAVSIVLAGAPNGVLVRTAGVCEPYTLWALDAQGQRVLPSSTVSVPITFSGPRLRSGFAQYGTPDCRFPNVLPGLLQPDERPSGYVKSDTYGPLEVSIDQPLGVAPPGEVIRFRGWAVLEERWTSGSCIANASVRFYGGTDAAPAFIVAPDTANALIASGSGGATVVVPVGTACSFMTKALQPVAGMGTIVGFGIHVTSLQPQDLTLDDAEFLRPMRNGLFSVSSGLATGADCTTGSCLSGLCAELADGGDRCLCAPPGVPCGANAGCCSLSCVGGRCQ